jgi:hypothetical protein
MNTMKRMKNCLAAVLLTLLAIAAFAGGAAADTVFRVTAGARFGVYQKVADSSGGTINDGNPYWQTRHFNQFKQYEPVSKISNQSGYDVYTFGALPQRYHYEAGGRGMGGAPTGFVRQVQEVTSTGNTTITVNVGALDVNYRVSETYMNDGAYFNVNDEEHLVMQAGETDHNKWFYLIPIRVWQVMLGVTDNYFFEPDYTAEILGDSGAVSAEWMGKPGLEYLKIAGKRKGVSVLRITYDPVRHFGTLNPGTAATVGASSSNTYYNAIDPLNTGVIVVNVVPDAANFNPANLWANIPLREYDWVYFDKYVGDHAKYTFTPTADSGLISVRVHKPIHAGGATWGAGWSDGTANPDGSFTIDLYDGRNIVEVSTDTQDFKQYHVVNAKGIDLNITNTSRPAWTRGQPLNAGETLQISFSGIRTPLEKISGIYNPGFQNYTYVVYKDKAGEEVRSAGTQYDLYTLSKNFVTVTVPQDGRPVLLDGYIYCRNIGSTLGSHRINVGDYVYPNGTASYDTENVEFAVMPDVLLAPAGSQAGIVDVKPEGERVPTAGTLEITFDAPMDTNEIGSVVLNPGNVTLTDGWWKAGSAYKYSVLYDKLDFGTNYSVTISGFKSQIGAVMTTPVIRNNAFKTTPPVSELKVVGGTGSGKYEAGAEVEIALTQAPVGRLFYEWQLTTGGGTIANPYAAKTTYTMSTGPAEIMAVYADAPTVVKSKINMPAQVETECDDAAEALYTKGVLLPESKTIESDWSNVMPQSVRQTGGGSGLLTVEDYKITASADAVIEAIRNDSTLSNRVDASKPVVTPSLVAAETDKNLKVNVLTVPVDFGALYAAGARSFKDISIFKVMRDGKLVEFIRKESLTGISSEGDYVIMGADGVAVADGTSLGTNGDYYIHVAIRDNSEYGYDWDMTVGSIIDPLVGAIVKESGGNDLDGNDPGGNDPGRDSNDGGSGGGGCDAGASGLFAAIAACVAALTRKKRV